MTGHSREKTLGQTRRLIVEIIAGWQAEKPDCFLPASSIPHWINTVTDISTQAVRTHLTSAVAEGSLTEVFVRRDWLVILPGGEGLPPLYPQLHEEGEVFELVRERPDSRGSNGLTFLLPPLAYEALLARTQGKFTVRG